MSRDLNRMTLGLGVIRVDHHDKYLAIRTLLLSADGRELLVKVVAQAIPLYVLNSFLLPRFFCDDLNKMVARFWWGGSDDEQKIHWLGWEQLCSTKCDGPDGRWGRGRESVFGKIVGFPFGFSLQNPWDVICLWFENVFSPAHVEALAAKEGLVMIVEMGLSNIILESDSLLITTVLQSHSTDMSFIGPGKAFMSRIIGAASAHVALHETISRSWFEEPLDFLADLFVTEA
ncbi:ribonuclease H protein [Pyrus ussuriensis x Pyrus communis]|uniref:Ribonuclease H protein n=1 Tax=Pyrus ussuriensis x Pyrus communis TaxID=2448454 RepID=A0A5N5HYP2_9ROSA|nr:ribonuclease H protein [Pyrus ussuriensis x Pyrus communis]